MPTTTLKQGPAPIHTLNTLPPPLQGPRYVLGDFSFKVLTVTHLFGAQERKFLGNVLELEYGPLVDMDMAQQVGGSWPSDSMLCGAYLWLP